MLKNKSLVHVGARTEVHVSEIVYLEANINYTLFHFLNGKKLLVAVHLGKLENRLQSFGDFVRPNRNTLVNVEYIKKFSRDTLHLKGMSIKVSRRRRDSLYTYLKSSNSN